MRQPAEISPPTDSNHEECLCDLKAGSCARVTGCRLEEQEGSMLRALGLRPNANVQVTRTGEPCIVKITDDAGSSCSLGISRRVAQMVTVSMHTA